MPWPGLPQAGHVTLRMAAQRASLPLIPEVLFSRCTPRGLADALAPLLLGEGAAAARAAQLQAVAPVRDFLLSAAPSRPSELAADVIMRLVRAREHRGEPPVEVLEKRAH